MREDERKRKEERNRWEERNNRGHTDHSGYSRSYTDLSNTGGLNNIKDSTGAPNNNNNQPSPRKETIPLHVIYPAQHKGIRILTKMKYLTVSLHLLFSCRGFMQTLYSISESSGIGVLVYFLKIYQNETNYLEKFVKLLEVEMQIGISLKDKLVFKQFCDIKVDHYYPTPSLLTLINQQHSPTSQSFPIKQLPKYLFFRLNFTYQTAIHCPDELDLSPLTSKTSRYRILAAYRLESWRTFAFVFSNKHYIRFEEEKIEVMEIPTRISDCFPIVIYQSI